MNQHGKLNYVEFPATDMANTKVFFEKAFGWQFVDYGPEYTAFSDQGLDGGFFKSDKSACTDNGSALVIFFSENIELTQSEVEAAGGVVIKPVYAFPGGRRFHFTDPSGNEFAVWAE